MIGRRDFLLGASAAMCGPSFAGVRSDKAADVVLEWYRLSLQLVRETATCSPPVAARTFAHLGVGLWEIVAACEGLASLSGQLNAFDRVPDRPEKPQLASAVHGALSAGVRAFFADTGSDGQQTIRVTQQHLSEQIPDFDSRSFKFGSDAMGGVVSWSMSDGGSAIHNLGFPKSFEASRSPQAWVPTSNNRLHQTPLLPDWGENRPMVLARAEDFMPATPHSYSTDRASGFYADAYEVYSVSLALSDEEKLIARFWSDDPMLTPTPPGHWISIILGIAEQRALPITRLVDALARVGISQNDSFIACWRAKYRHNLLRPVTYIRRNIDETWQPLIHSPPFPEYPSGHSSQSAAAAEVLTDLFGEDYAFNDTTHARDGLPVRQFASFREAAAEAAMSRLYGGIHFRRANEQGAVQGIRVANAVLGLKTV